MEKSQSIKEIAKALMLFQTKMDKIKKDATNPFYKSTYASLSTILEHIQIPLAESGLTFSQFPDGECLTTILMHGESGEFMQACYSVNPVPEYSKEKDKEGNVVFRSASFISPQSIGSAITYARRYALSAILGLNVDDDDANEASKTAMNGHVKEESKKEFPEDNRPWLTEKQLDGAVSRILQGEKDVFEKTTKAFRMKKEYKTTLTQTLNSVK